MPLPIAHCVALQVLEQPNAPPFIHLIFGDDYVLSLQYTAAYPDEVPPIKVRSRDGVLGVPKAFLEALQAHLVQEAPALKGEVMVFMLVSLATEWLDGNSLQQFADKSAPAGAGPAKGPTGGKGPSPPGNAQQVRPRARRAGQGSAGPSFGGRGRPDVRCVG